MIKNEKQYKITNKKLQELKDAINDKYGAGNPLPAKNRLLLTSLQTLREQLQNEIDDYNRLKTELQSILMERTIDELPNLLIEFKIQSGMTQKEFSQKIGMKEQQLQRYEAENFNSISFKNLLRILHAVGLEVTVKGNMPGNNQSAA